MASQPDPKGVSPEQPDTFRDAQVLRWRSVVPPLEGRMTDPVAQEKLRPARGLLVGLLLGAVMWMGLLAFAWQFFR